MLERLVEALPLVVFLAFLTGVGCCIYYNVQHPCVRYESYEATCGGECTAYVHFNNGSYSMVPDYSQVPVCVSYAPTYPCTQQQCVERKP